ncbi:MAG: hypothetical protein QXJ75_00605 [Candidatus Bathyarchaeia archaeon]
MEVLTNKVPFKELRRCKSKDNRYYLSCQDCYEEDYKTYLICLELSRKGIEPYEFYETW